jgi:hypothetical protein
VSPPVRTRLAPWLIVGLFLLSLPAVTTRFYASDEVEFFSWLHSAAFDRDADFQNEYQHFYDVGVVHTDGFRATFLDDVNEAGRRPNFAPIGTALLWAPFYAGGHVWALVTGAVADGLSQPYIAAVAYGSAVYGALALLLSAAIARRVAGAGDQLATLAVWLGTPLVFYMYIAPGFSHACSAFAVSLFLWQWLRVRTVWSLPGVVGLGVIGALLPMVREQDAFFLIGPALDFVVWAWRRGSAEPRAAVVRDVTARAVAGAAALAVGYLPQLIAYHALNRHFGPTVKVARKMTWSSPHFLEVLWSPEHGFLFWTPLAVIAVVGLLVLATARRADPTSRDARQIAALAMVMLIAQVYVSGCVESWTVAGSFGQRRFVATTPLLVLGLATLLRHASATRWLTLLATTVAIWWNLGLMAQFGLHTMDRQRLALADNARATFVTLPRTAPSLAWRYLTDRASFYDRAPQ